MNYPLANSAWDQEEINAMQEVIASGMFTMGEKVAAFEKAFADYTGSSYCVMVNSGSSANLLMIAALRYSQQHPVLPGDEVIVPAVSWSTTYYPLYQYGLRVKFVDVDIDTLNYDLAQLENAINDKTRAIMAVNLLGNPNDFHRIRQLIGNRDILLLEDNCESMGALFDEQQTGTFGLMGSFSTFFSHHISTMEGGLIIAQDEELYHILLALRAHGWTRHLPRHNKVCGTKKDDPFSESFRFVLPGYNVRPLELSGAIGLCQLKKLPEIVKHRRENAEKFLALMQDYPFVRTQQEIGKSSWFGFSLLLNENSPFNRQQALEAFHSHGIDARPIVAGNFAKNEVLRWFDYTISGSLTNADTIDQYGFFIGNHHYPLNQELTCLQDALSDLTSAKAASL